MVLYISKLPKLRSRMAIQCMIFILLISDLALRSRLSHVHPGLAS